jgi:LmbE family N-acetylglucosaminyl deacetylase
MTTLVIAPHPDDETIGCGGTLCLHAQRGGRAVVVFLTSGELGLKHLPPEEARRTREKEAEAAAVILGLSALHFLRLPDWGCAGAADRAAAALASILAAEAPELILLPHPADDHPDHRASLPIAGAALDGHPDLSPELRGYEVWAPLPAFDYVEDITTVMDRKLRAVAAYPSQLESFRYDRAVSGLAEYRGALAGRCDYAEVMAHLSPAAARA